MISRISFTQRFILLFLLCYSFNAFSYGDGLTICNKNKKYTLKISAVWYIGNAFRRAWMSRGWYTVRPGHCEAVSSGSNVVNNDYYLSVLRVNQKGEVGIYVPVNPGIEEVFCVRELGKFDEGFELKRSTLAALKQCPSGYSLQLFNIKVNSKMYTRYRLTIN